MSSFLFLFFIIKLTIGQDFLSMISPFLGSSSINGGAIQNGGFLGGMSPLNHGQGNNLFSLFTNPTPLNEKEKKIQLSTRDYDDQIVHSKKSGNVHRSKGKRKWNPIIDYDTRKNSLYSNIDRSRLSSMPAPIVKSRLPLMKDYDDVIDIGITEAKWRSNRERGGVPPPPPSRFRPTRFVTDEISIHSPIIKNNGESTINNDEVAPDDTPNIVGEISSFSSAHQTTNGNYRNVEKIMEAFNKLFDSPNKSKKIRMNDYTEVGKNEALSSKLFQSDIVLTVPQMKSIVLSEKDEMEGTGRRQKRKVITGGVYRWPNPSDIPFRFKGNNQRWKELIIKGMKMWENETCIRFHENYGTNDYILFYKGSGCFSSVGKTGGSQMISLGYGCDDIGIIAHEIAHSLGFWHEQSRSDRDYYIRIRREFISSGMETNFVKQWYTESDSMGLPYDFGSIMHYGPEAFTTRENEVTIETLNKNFESTIGQRWKPSFIDIKQMNRLYCNDACHGMQLACRHGGYPDPNNCQLCKCPDGLSGPICRDIEGTCGSDLIAGNGWQEINHRGKGDCVWRIKTRNGKIRLRVSNADFECKRTCESFVEVKSSNDFQETGFRICCSNEEATTVSEGEEVLVILRSNNMERDNSFRLQYVKVNSITEEIDSNDLNNKYKAPAIKPWVAGQENRPFRGIDNGPVEKFILNSISSLKKYNRPELTIASSISEDAISKLFQGQKK